jgi:hypothetical protein
MNNKRKMKKKITIKKKRKIRSYFATKKVLIKINSKECTSHRGQGYNAKGSRAEVRRKAKPAED